MTTTITDHWKEQARYWKKARHDMRDLRNAWRRAFFILAAWTLVVLACIRRLP